MEHLHTEYQVGGATIHHLKTWPLYFEAVISGEKTFEIRREDDRQFSVGDTLLLQEYSTGNYTGREIRARVTYCMREPQFVLPGYVVMGIRPEGPQC